MRITDALLAEHGVICQLLDHIARCAPEWNPDQAREAGASLATVLRRHAATEEELLFDVLERTLGHEPVPLAVLRLEHEEIEAILDDVASVGSLEEIQLQLRRLVKLAGDHFAKEEGILFPLANDRLDEETLNRLGSRWATARQLDIGVRSV